MRETSVCLDLQDIPLILKSKAQKTIYNRLPFVKRGRIKIYIRIWLYLQVATCRVCGKGLDGMGARFLGVYLFIGL